MTTVKSFYAISAMDKAHGHRVFLAIDAHSGGYPYWYHDVMEAKRFESCKDALEYRNVPSFSGDVTNACVMLITIDARDFAVLPLG